MLSVIITVIKRSLFLTLNHGSARKNYHSIVWKGDCCAHRTLHQQRVCAFSRLAGGARVGQFSYHIPISIPILLTALSTLRQKKLSARLSQVGMQRIRLIERVTILRLLC